MAEKAMVELDLVIAVIEDFFDGYGSGNDDRIRDDLLEDIRDIPRLGWDGLLRNHKEVR